MKTLRQRFNEKWVESENGCWEWKASKDHVGYGWIRVNGKTVKAHRWSWEFHNGREIPEGMCICHNCPSGDNPGCVNPEHLVCRDNAWNHADKAAKGRSPRGEKNPIAKITELQARQIKIYCHMGAKQSKVAEIYSISPQTVCDIKKGRAWSHA